MTRDEPVSWDPFLIKRRLLAPYFGLMRRFRVVERLERIGNPAMATAFAEHNFGPAFAKHIVRFLLNPTVLYVAPVPDVRVVLDVGAFDGAWAATVHERTGARIFSFEPDPAGRVRAQARLAGKRGVRVFPYGLGARTGEVELSQVGPGSTAFVDALARVKPEVRRYGQVRIRIRDVKEVFDELALHQVDFVKINIEGGEYDLLERLIETGYIRRCRSLLVQFHEWMPGAYARRRRIHRALRRTHRLDWSDYFVWESWSKRESVPAASSGPGRPWGS
jgi:FkbM family methyltransferase